MRRLLVRIWASRWTPMFVVLGLFGAYYGYRHFGPNAVERDTYELNGDLLVHGNPTLKEVALTFDDGPYGDTTELILQTLAEENVQATFFVVGKHVEERPELVRKIMASGHEVGNHTYSHPRLTDISTEEAEKELRQCEASVFRATGAHMNLMRPPGMKFNDDLLKLNMQLGYTTIHWNAVAGDYVPTDPELIAKRILWQAQSGSVILLHDTPDTAKALPYLIRRLKADGYRFVTVTQMLARLPRPVFLASNAGHVSAIESAPAAPPATNVRRAPRKQKEKGATAERLRPAVDVPTWDGPGDDIGGDESASIA